jgi:hypothetical protein
MVRLMWGSSWPPRLSLSARKSINIIETGIDIDGTVRRPWVARALGTCLARGVYEVSVTAFSN